MSDVSHSRHRIALWCGQCRRLLYDFLRPIRYSAWSIRGFCPCLFNIYGRLVNAMFLRSRHRVLGELVLPYNCAQDGCESVHRSFVIAGRGPAYSGPQRWDLLYSIFTDPTRLQLFYDGMGTTNPLRGQSVMNNVGVFYFTVKNFTKCIQFVLCKCTLVSTMHFKWAEAIWFWPGFEKAGRWVDSFRQGWFFWWFSTYWF